jgi:hypothetical protein
MLARPTKLPMYRPYQAPSQIQMLARPTKLPMYRPYQAPSQIQMLARPIRSPPRPIAPRLRATDEAISSAELR